MRRKHQVEQAKKQPYSLNIGARYELDTSHIRINEVTNQPENSDLFDAVTEVVMAFTESHAELFQRPKIPIAQAGESNYKLPKIIPKLPKSHRLTVVENSVVRCYNPSTRQRIGSKDFGALVGKVMDKVGKIEITPTNGMVDFIGCFALKGSCATETPFALIVDPESETHERLTSERLAIVDVVAHYLNTNPVRDEEDGGFTFRVPVATAYNLGSEHRIKFRKALDAILPYSAELGRCKFGENVETYIR